jgi:hypothetical protein
MSITSTAALALGLALQGDFTQQAYVKATNTGAFDAFGFAVALDGDTLVVGAPNEDGASTGVGGDQASNAASSAGAVYVYVRHGLDWVPQAYLKASNAGAGDLFGWSVAIDGDVLVVGAVEEDSAATGVDGNQADDSAFGAGAAYVFVRSGSTWTQAAYLKASNTDADDQFGWSVAVDGDTVVVGVPRERSAATGVNGDASDDSASWAGAAYVFVETGGVWSQQAYLKASNAQAGDEFGYSVALDGETLVVGARGEDSIASVVNGNQSADVLNAPGAAYVFVRDTGVWSQEAYLKATNPTSNDWFGTDVDVDGDTAVVGALGEGSASTGVNGVQGDNSLPGAGAAYVFVREAGLWSFQAYVKASATDVFDAFGASLAVAGDTLVVGAPFEDGASVGIGGDDTNDGAADSGAAFVFTRSGSTWTQAAYVKAANTGGGDEFGGAVALDGRTFVCGAMHEDGAAVGVGGNAASNGLGGSGAAYVFTDHHWGEIEGCLVNPAGFQVPAGDATIGATVGVVVDAASLLDGVGAAYWGAKSVDASGCGALLAPTEELLLALVPAPTLLGLAPLVAGSAAFAFDVPADPALVGIQVALQAVLVDTSTFASEFSRGLEFEIRP